MSHDLVAELGGYRNELVIAARSGRTDRLDSVQAQVDRVAAAVTAKAEALEAAAADVEAGGQDVIAAGLRVQARALRDALGQPETAQDSSPLERAVPKKARA